MSPRLPPTPLLVLEHALEGDRERHLRQVTRDLEPDVCYDPVLSWCAATRSPMPCLRKLRDLERIPLPTLVALLRAWPRPKPFGTIATRHTLAAFDEMKVVSTDFQSLARSTTTATPALDTLHAGLASWTT